MTQLRDAQGRFLPRVTAIPDEHDPMYQPSIPRRWDDDMGYYPTTRPSIWRRILAWLGI